MSGRVYGYIAGKDPPSGHVRQLVGKEIVLKAAKCRAPAAWCAACEQFFLAEGDKTPRFLKFNQMALVCDVCYSDLKDRHSILTDP